MSIWKKMRELFGNEFDEDDDFYDDFDYEDYYVSNHNSSKRITSFNKTKENKIPRITRDTKAKGLNENVQEKIIMNEMLNVNEYAELLEYALEEFKRTFSCPNKDIEIVFRDTTKKEKSDENER